MSADASTSGLPPSSSSAWQSVQDVLMLRNEGARITVVWLALGSVLAEFATRVTDYMDFDAGRYERLAVSVARTGSLVPRIHDVNIHYVSMLYPVFLAPFFVSGAMWKDLQNAGVASAYLMSSVCIPAFLLTRRLTGPRTWQPYFVAIFSVCTPWIVLSLSLMTEVASYPASVWAVYAMVVAISSPSSKHDLLAVVAIALAFLARGELIVLAGVFPLAILAFELGRSSGPDALRRSLAAGRSSVRSHPVLSTGYGLAVLFVLGLAAVGRLGSTIGIYSVYSSAGHPAWSRLPRALVEHLATFSLGVAVLPCVIALAWMGASVVRPPAKRDAHAFACIATVMTIVVFVQATNFDLVVNAYIHDRFLMYFVPVMLVGAVAGMADVRRLRWSLALPLALIVAGFATGEIPPATWQRFEWLDLDTPVSTVYRALARHLGGLTETRLLLIAIAISGTALVAGARMIPARVLSVLVYGFCAIGMFFATEWTFVRAFNPLDRNDRQLTATLHGTLDWIDESVGTDARVTAVQFPVSSDWFVNEKAWVDYEYFNKSIVRNARKVGADPFDYNGFWFPKLDLHFDARTGAVAESPTRWVAASVGETRFRISGPAKFNEQNVQLIDAGPRWRLDWLTFGLYDDGWTRPGATARLRLFATAGQQEGRIRTVTLVLHAPAGVGQRIVTVTVQGKTSRFTVTRSAATVPLSLCVPRRGYADIRLAVDGSATIPGDLATLAQSLETRRGGVFIASIGEADEIGAVCTAPA